MSVSKLIFWNLFGGFSHFIEVPVYMQEKIWRFEKIMKRIFFSNPTFVFFFPRKRLEFNIYNLTCHFCIKVILFWDNLLSINVWQLHSVAVVFATASLKSPSFVYNLTVVCHLQVAMPRPLMRISMKQVPTTCMLLASRCLIYCSRLYFACVHSSLYMYT